MTEDSVTPNKQQKKLVKNTEGLYLVNAGAGTGKTFTITRRYVKILENAEPDDIFLATFTRNAADEMAERIASESGYEASDIWDAPISTFHSHCQKILERNGFSVPQEIGIDDRIESIDVLESQIRERQEFNRFMDSFIQERPEYSDFYRITRSYDNLLHLVKSLASKGIIPEEEGWYQDTEAFLDGDKEEFLELFEQANRPRKSENGQKQSDLRSRLYSFKYKNFPEDAPTEEDVRGGYGTKTVRKDFGRKAFEEDREELKAFIHDLYFEYVRYCLSRNYLNFSFLMVFAYILLREDSSVRKRESFEYMMIDEFQDTNPLQFKLALLLADKPNIAAVGDWKQSIYSFQYASVENIKEFRQRLKKFKKELNRDRTRVDFPVEEVKEIKLTKNYRSTQQILDLAEQSLGLPANKYENVDEKSVKGLESEIENQESCIEKYVAEEEVEAVLTKILEIVGNPDYIYGEEERELDYKDVAVLTRTRGFGLKLQEKAREHGIPVAYEGGVELFKTDPAILLLAWLRVLNNKHSRNGWAVILERAGYRLEEARKILEEDEEYEYPEDMKAFREKLGELNSVSGVCRTVFKKYGYSNAFTDRITEVLTDVFTSSYMNLGELIQFIEENIEENEIYEVDSSKNRNTVKIQTIHAAKGLEYPAVFIADVNQGKFPSKNSDSKAITYQDPVGLRQRKIYRNEGLAFEYDNWRTEILMKSLSGDYDEERRLMYVAMTRAEQHLFITAEEGRESTFFKGLDPEASMLEPDIKDVKVDEEKLEVFEAEKPDRERKELLSVHSKMEVEEEGDREKGEKLHRFAEKYVKNNADASTKRQKAVKKFIDSLQGIKEAEKEIRVSSGRKVYSGVIDLVHKTEEKVEVIEYKTDSHPGNMEQYVKQLKTYVKGLEQKFDKPVEGKIVCVKENGSLSIKELDIPQDNT
ncbi:MAG: UvrD-helicase domain-containing protein [Candidatus Nanohalobium sp.]